MPKRRTMMEVPTVLMTSKTFHGHERSLNVAPFNPAMIQGGQCGPKRDGECADVFCLAAMACGRLRGLSVSPRRPHRGHERYQGIAAAPPAIRGGGDSDPGRNLSGNQCAHHSGDDHL